jgi:hypothetical protein
MRCGGCTTVLNYSEFYTMIQVSLSLRTLERALKMVL